MTLAHWDHDTTLRWFHATHRSAGLRGLMWICARLAIWALFAMVLVWAVCFGGGWITLGLTGIALFLGMMMGWTISTLADRDRPFVTHRFTPDIGTRFLGRSFPSDHALVAFALATSVALIDVRVGAVFLALAAVIAIGRVGVGVHYVSDILAGALIGSGAAGVVFCGFWLAL